MIPKHKRIHITIYSGYQDLMYVKDLLAIKLFGERYLVGKNKKRVWTIGIELAVGLFKEAKYYGIQLYTKGRYYYDEAGREEVKELNDWFAEWLFGSIRHFGI